MKKVWTSMKTCGNVRSVSPPRPMPALATAAVTAESPKDTEQQAVLVTAVYAPSNAAFNEDIRAAERFNTGKGYTTLHGRAEWIRGQHLDSAEAQRIPDALVADSNPNKPLYFWQLFSLLGPHRIMDLVESFYQRVYADKDNDWFRDAFIQIGSIGHHVATQTQFWIDAMGGGKQYHGGAAVWMRHMRLAVSDHAADLDAIDRRIRPCVMEFLRTKMKKYSEQHMWDFDESDFVGNVPVGSTAAPDAAVGQDRQRVEGAQQVAPPTERTTG